MCFCLICWSCTKRLWLPVEDTLAGVGGMDLLILHGFLQQGNPDLPTDQTRWKQNSPFCPKNPSKSMAVLTSVADVQASLDRVYIPVGPGGKVVLEVVITSGRIWSLLVSEAVAFRLFCSGDCSLL